MVVSAKLRKFDHSLEEAALNLGATRFQVMWHITLRYLRSSIIGSGAVVFLMSFENFNTTLFLVGSPAHPAHQPVPAGPRRLHPGHKCHFPAAHRWQVGAGPSNLYFDGKEAS